MILKNKMRLGLSVMGLVFFLLMSCNKPTSKQVMRDLNGYWQIEKVQSGDQVKEYKFGSYVDYIEVDPGEQKGVRIKVQPQMDSTFKTTKDAEHFTLRVERDSLRFHYKTRMDEWQETVVSAKKNEFTVRNKYGMLYTYKRFEGLDKVMKAHEQQ